MIRKSFLAAMAFGLCGIGAAQAETTFIGAAKITAVTTQCKNIQAGWKFTAQFHPYLATQSDKSEGFSLQGGMLGGDGITLRNHVLDTTFRAADAGGLGWGGVYNFDTAHAPQIAIVGTRPAITTTTSTVVLTWQVKRPNSDPGGLACIATYKGAFIKDQ